jgi:lysozyme
MDGNQGKHGLDPRAVRRLIDAQRRAKATAGRSSGSRIPGSPRPAGAPRPTADPRPAGAPRAAAGPRSANDARPFSNAHAAGDPRAQRSGRPVAGAPGGPRSRQGSRLAGSARAAGGAAYDGSEGDLPSSFASFLRMNGRGVLSVVVTLVVVVIILFAVRGCMGSGDQSQAPEPASSSAAEQPAQSSGSAASAYVSPYDWSNLTRTNGRYAYTVDGQVVSRLGVDVSEHQTQVNWNSVAADGIDFAIVRVGYRGSSDGDIHADQYFAGNIDGAQAAGLDTGVYFFSQANTVEEAQEEADFVLSQLGGRQLDYPVVFDSETNATGVGMGRTANLSRTQMTQIAQAFCQRIEEAGYRAMVYGNTADMARYNLTGLSDYPVWWAEYGQPYPTARMDFTLWQYTNTGSVAGIDGDVDLSIDLSAAL